MNKLRKERRSIKTPAFVKKVIDILNGSFLGKDQVVQFLPFAAFLTLIMVCYISYGYFTERSVKELNLREAELKDVKSEHLTWQSQLDSLRQQSSVARQISNLGLDESTEPLVEIQKIRNED
ncbi:MAG: FtsL-like putative cell division protein [Bacteroidota bacterium]